jgi:GNAT superfamily N-acetyltransferase
MADTITVHPADGDDTPNMLGLVEAYLDFYGVARPPADRILRFIVMLRENPQIGIQFVAHTPAGGAIGFATLLISYDTLILERVATLNDLYVSPTFRRRGVGRALIERCRCYVRERGMVRMEWVTAKDNAKAQAFYDRLGATRCRWVSYEISPVQEGCSP